MTIYAEIDSNLERKFRVKVLNKYGSKKGALRKALEEAIREWLKDA